MKAIPMNRLRLGFNVDHVATLRNARGEAYPDPVDAARIAVAAGADGITAHLREDRRHMRDADMHRLRAEIAAPLNFEMGATDEMVAIALSVRPHACCLVPERRAEVTTEGGLDVVGNVGPLRATVARLAEAGIRVSLFIDPDIRQLDAALAVGAPMVELHTGPYAHATEPTAHRAELARLEAAAAHADRIGIECHAGHGLTFANVGAVAAIPTLAELNIGHFLVSHAVLDGLPATIARMRALMDAARGAT
jgi:pyridoxine 5-phosphate synthase